jgi:hypothetical protein
MTDNSDDAIITEAKSRFKKAEEWESEARNNFIFDMRFANGDSSNLYQWDDDISDSRNRANRPCLTINKTKQHCLQIINDQRQNQSQIEVRPVGNGASYEAAKVFEGICRHIEYQSNAQAAYSNACYSQVVGGIGYWRVTTDYASDDSFDQEIFIKRIQDTLSVYLDPDISEADGSDARYGFIFTEMPRDEFEHQYPDEDDVSNQSSPFSGTGFAYDAWDAKDHVRIAEYFRKSNKSDKLHELDNGTTVRESDVKRSETKSPGMMNTLDAHSLRSREVDTPDIEWYLIAGNRIIEKKIFPGRYIPIVRVIGEETIIDKVLDRRGHTRALIDPQRIYNFWSSSAVEFVALQSKVPYMAAVEAIAGFELDYENANVENKAYLPYNSIDAAGNQIPKPERAPPPVMAQAYLEGMKIAAGEMQLVSGQYEANMGQKSNEVSGTAVDARQRQGENATYHYIDRFAQAIRFTGRILVGLIPLVYDTERVMKILSESGEQSTIHVNPNAQQGHQQVQDPDSPEFDPQAISAIFNPLVGIFDVEADIGPAYSSRRQETFHALSEILKADPQWMPIVGDIMMRAADFPMADELAERLRNMVPPQALGKGPDPEVQKLQQMLAQQAAIMTKQGEELVQAKAKQGALFAQKDIDTYNAETLRMKAVGAIDPDALRVVVRQLVSDALGTRINPLIAAHAAENAAMAQPPAPPPSQVLPPTPTEGAAQ